MISGELCSLQMHQPLLLFLPWRKNSSILHPAINPPTPITAEALAGMSQAAEWAVTIFSHHLRGGDGGE